MRFIRLTALLTLAASLLYAASHTDLIGFEPASANAQLALEKRYDSLLRADNLDRWMREYTRKPHHIGSPFGKEVAESMAAKFRSWGYETEIEEFQVLLPTPKKRVLEMVAPERYQARLDEPALEMDETSAVTEDRLPPYNAFSIDGDVTGELVYVNYGVPKDYEKLEELGIDVKGKIVIARYGGSWRGIKPKVAAEHGAIGCILYSDPRDDGYYQGDAYPEGAWRMEWGAQRGSVADMPLYPGDPLTPGIGATRNAKRLPVKDAPTLTKIPVLPISWGDALPLLRHLGGPVAPESWRGALPITYHVGPGPAKVHLALEFDWKLRPAYDVIAKMRGSERPDEWIVRGNHHDAWVFGADDPISGMVALMEEARVVGELARSGARPKRTIVYAGWDAEEPGLLGSTEWAETHADELKRKAVAYINSDSNGRGFLYMLGSHTLERLINQTARDVEDPQTGVTVWKRAQAQRIVQGDREDAEEARNRADLRLYALGSGSDYTPFLQHLGIASMHIGFGGEEGGGSYHSIYDSYDHYKRFGDPGFQYGIALAKVAGRATLRLANADVIPLRFASFADAVSKYANEVEALATEMRKDTELHNFKVREGLYRTAADPKRTYVAPKAKDPVPHLNFAPLKNAVAKLEKSAERYDAALSAAIGRGIPAATEAQINQILIGIERAMSTERGLPRRPWFKHQIYAPGFYTGYGVKTLPAIREAIEQRDWREAETEMQVVARTIERVATQIDRATALVEGR